MQLVNMTKSGLVKHSLIGLLLITLAGCCGSTDSFARLTNEEIEYIPFTDVEHVDFVDESGEVLSGNKCNLQDYLDEYAYRFNCSTMNGAIFDNLLTRAVRHSLTPYKYDHRLSA